MLVKCLEEKLKELFQKMKEKKKRSKQGKKTTTLLKLEKWPRRFNIWITDIPKRENQTETVWGWRDPIPENVL